MSESIQVVDTIDFLGIAKSRPPLLIVGATGRTRTSGWRNGRLIPREYATEPPDGIQDFDFVADPPSGIVLPYLAQILASHVDIAPSWLRGIRIHSATNDIERSMAPTDNPLFSSPLDDAEPGASDGFGLSLADYGLSIDVREAGGSRLVGSETEIHFHELEDSFEISAAALDARCYEYTVASLSGWPETKTVMEHKCIIKIGGKCRASMHVPVIYRRTSELRIVARVCLPTEDDLRKIIEDCVKEAIAAGALAGVLTGNLAAFAAALQAYLKTCLAKNGIAAAQQLSVRLSLHKQSGPWKRI